ncbi:hypothetical protein H4217_006730 [Coemansia sp. RSA 1939]|nr:hypothetical protein H4217_006730 [Coemansia sp. RSA 1939]KAJ2588399.1 hypothetical protein EV177_009427 [Coemansia sp. RSA 1804]KAJ2681872.1 hypothetical protein GGH99_004996 [Coemansia sp. RSA 1285]
MFRIITARSARPMTLRLAQTQTAARRFASDDSNKTHGALEEGKHNKEEGKEEYVFEEEGFGSPIWKYTLGGLAALYLLGQYDDYIERTGRVHPLKRFFANSMNDVMRDRRVFAEHEREVAKQAEFNILQREEKRTIESTLDEAVYFKRTANWGVPVGTSVDMSVAKDRTPIKE